MLFWIFVITLIIGVSCIILHSWLWDNTEYSGEWLMGLGATLAIVMGVVIIVCLVFICGAHITADAVVAENHARYEALTYQLENDLYENDNDIGKKALYSEIREWNEDLAYYQTIQDDFWVGIFYPDVFDQFEFIEYPRSANDD